ncbi:hypothetical protein ACLOJK_001700 [Asimina triloba]
MAVSKKAVYLHPDDTKPVEEAPVKEDDSKELHPSTELVLTKVLPQQSNSRKPLKCLERSYAVGCLAGAVFIGGSDQGDS